MGCLVRFSNCSAVTEVDCANISPPSTWHLSSMGWSDNSTGTVNDIVSAPSHTIRLNWNCLFVLSVCSFPFCAPHFLHALLPVAARAVLIPLGNFLGRGKSQVLDPHSFNT